MAQLPKEDDIHSTLAHVANAEPSATEVAGVDDDDDDDDDLKDDLLDLQDNSTRLQPPSVLETDPWRAKFSQLLHLARENRLHLNNAEARVPFRNEHESLFSADAKCQDKKTLLHFILHQEELPVNQDVIRLAIMALKHGRDLVNARDQDGCTPFQIAFQRRHYLWILILFRHLERKRESALKLRNMLEARLEDQGNCLHIALRAARLSRAAPDDIYYQVLEAAVRTMSPAALLMTDVKRLTPLHLAVDFSCCNNPRQITLVKALVNKAPEALDRVNHKGMSPYQYHQDTKAKLLAGLSGTLFPGSATVRDRDEFWALGVAGVHSGPGPAIRHSLQAASASAPRTLMTHSTLASLGAELPSAYPSGASTVPRPSKQIDQFPAARAAYGPVPTGTSTPMRRRENLNDNASEMPSATKMTISSNPNTEYAGEIEEYMKLWCLRTMSHSQAVERLYGRNLAGKEICFSYCGLGDESRPVNEKRFRATFGHMIFSNILQYIAIPRVRVNRTKPLADFDRAIRSQPQSGGVQISAREDASFFFEWLRQKGVTRILRVHVNEPSHDNQYHSDEAIERCLGGLKVESLDWRKPDLCPITIENACPELKQLHLYWSGTNAVLRGWSEKEGLPKLKKLELVHVYPTKGLNASDHQRNNLRCFADRLKENASLPTQDGKPRKKPLAVEIDGGFREAWLRPRISRAPSLGLEKDEGDRHRWINIVKVFAQQIVNVEMPQLQNGKFPYEDEQMELLRRPIRIAIIDDGVDVSIQDLGRSIDGGKSLYRDEPGAFEPEHGHYWPSDSGHGTAMAGYILQVFPHARLYILRMENTSSTDEGGLNFTARSAIEAIHTAVDYGVDIICMSWVIHPTDEERSQQLEIKLCNAILNAYEKRIFMCCAADDRSGDRDRGWPASILHEQILHVAAADENGRPWAGSGEAELLVPGTRIPPNLPGDMNSKPQTGSSVATALAAGLVGLFLHCAQVAAARTAAAGGSDAEDAIGPRQYYALRRGGDFLGRMRAAIRDIGTSASSGNKFVEVWNALEGPAKELESRLDQDAKRLIITQLVRKLFKI